MSLSINDFCPVNTWTEDVSGAKYLDGQPQFIRDETTGKLYLNESLGTIRFKCFLLTLATPLVHAVASIRNIAFRIFRLAFFYHFVSKKEGEGTYNFKARLADAGKDLLRLVATPLSIVGLELAAFYGIIRPHDGRKLYASIETGIYGRWILAPCFQPNPDMHLLGGNTNKRDSW